MQAGNRGFAQRIAEQGATGAETRLPPRTGVLAARENRLAVIAAGGAVTRVQELIDPTRCRMWVGHNRDYSALDVENCADLIESLRAQGRQEVPAIVRRLAAGDSHDYEIVCGARRHWSVIWLRAHDRPEIRFLIEPRELTDEEAFRVADLENRNRRDLSDYERAKDYARAVDLYYEGNQARMVERLQVSKSWLSRYLELARLPDEVRAAFGSPHAIGISHAASLAPVLKHPTRRAPVLARAGEVAAEQSERMQRGNPPLPPAAVLRQILALEASPRPVGNTTIVRDATGASLFSVVRGRSGTVTISLTREVQGRKAEVIEALSAFLDQVQRASAPRRAARRGEGG